MKNSYRNSILGGFLAFLIALSPLLAVAEVVVDIVAAPAQEEVASGDAIDSTEETQSAEQADEDQDGESQDESDDQTEDGNGASEDGDKDTETEEETSGLFSNFANMMFETLLMPLSLTTNDTTVVVKATDMNGWSQANTVGGTVAFVHSAGSPLGAGALNLKTLSDNQDRAGLARVENVALSKLTAMSYSTKRGAGFNDAGNASYRVLIDADGDDSTTSDRANLVFEPYWQNEAGDPAPVAQDVWQNWDVLNGKLWASIPGGNSVSGLTNGAGGPPLYSISDVVTLHPNAKVIGLNIGIGSYNLEYDVLVDELVFGYEDASSIDTFTYDFDPAPLTPPSVTFESPTPAENAYVKGTITLRALATDDFGMGSYYLRFWKDAYEIAGGGTLAHNCQSAPGADLLGTSVDASCTYDTKTNADGTYVLSAQFLDSHNKWGQVQRTITVDNTKPVATLVTPSGPTTVFNGDFEFAIDATDNLALNKITGNIYKDGSLFKSNSKTVSGTSGSYTFGISTLPEGNYTLRYNSSDMAGNVSSTNTFDFSVDNTDPTITIKNSPDSLGNGTDTFRKVSFKLFDAGKIDKVTINGVVKDLSDNQWSDVNNVAPGVFGAVEGNNTIVAYDVAGNTTTLNFVLDITAPTLTIKPESVGNGVDLFKNVSFKLYDKWKIDKVVINGVEKDLSNNQWSDVNGVKPGTFGAVEGSNTIVVYDVAGNTTTLTFTLDTQAPTVPVITSPASEQVFASTPIHNQWTASTDATSVKYQVAYAYDDGHTFGASTCADVSEIDGKSVSGCRDSLGTSRNHVPALNEQGGVTVWVRAIDELGNTSGWSVGVHYVYQVPGEPEPEAPTYDITFDEQGGDDVIDFSDLAEGDTVTLPTPTRSGYVFEHWYTTSDGIGGTAYAAGEIYTVPATDVTLYAIWTLEEEPTTEEPGTDPEPPQSSRTTSSGSRRVNTQPVVGEVLGATTEDLCGSIYLSSYLKQGGANDASQVTLLQKFLTLQGFSVPATGFFGPLTKAAVIGFQNKYADEVLKPWGTVATGIVYKTTRWKINNLACPGSEEFPQIP